MLRFSRFPVSIKVPGWYSTMKPLWLLLVVGVGAIVVACSGSQAPNRDIEATVPAAVQEALPTPTPTATPNVQITVVIPDIQATVQAGIQATLTADPTPTPVFTDGGVFLRVIAPLDEVRGYCLDIPGHRTGVRIDSPLQVHTCKHGIWNQDGRFELAGLGSGVIRMPHYDLCLQAENTSIGAGLLLTQCTEADLQSWALLDSGQIALEAFPLRCITVAEGPGRDAGGPQYLMKGVGLDVCAQEARDRQQWTTAIPQ